MDPLGFQAVLSICINILFLEPSLRGRVTHQLPRTSSTLNLLSRTARTPGFGSMCAYFVPHRTNALTVHFWTLSVLWFSKTAFAGRNLILEVELQLTIVSGTVISEKYWGGLMNRPESIRRHTHGTSDTYGPDCTSDRKFVVVFHGSLESQYDAPSRCEKRFPRSETPSPLSRCFG